MPIHYNKLKNQFMPDIKPETKSNKPKVSVSQCGVRFDKSHDQWGILDSDLKAVRTFERGIIVDATMKAHNVRVGIGCGAHSDVIGAAYGEVHENTYGGDKYPKTGFKNLEFKNGVFINGEGERIEEASIIRLMPGRKATYRP